MARRCLGTVVAATAVFAAACAGGTERAGDPTAAAPAPAPVTLASGCTITTTGAAALSVSIEDRPGLVASDHWFTEDELAALGDGFGALLVSCTSAEADMALWSLDDVPMQPGSYSLGTDGSFAVSGRVGAEQVAPAAGGTLRIDRFDYEGLAAEIRVPMSSTVDASHTYEVQVTVNLACRGLSLCAGAPSANR